MEESNRTTNMYSLPGANRPTSCQRRRSNTPRSYLCSQVICKLCASIFRRSSSNSSSCTHFCGGSVVDDISSITPPPSPESLASLRARGDIAPTHARLSKSRTRMSASRRPVRNDPAQRLSVIAESEEPVVPGAEKSEDAENTAPSTVGVPDLVSNTMSNDIIPPQPYKDFDVHADIQHHHVHRHLNNSALSLNPDMYYFPETELDEEKKIRRVGADLFDEAMGFAIGAEAYLFGVFVAERFGL